jgi:DNA-binding IclR family transcriptional regulator
MEDNSILEVNSNLKECSLMSVAAVERCLDLVELLADSAEGLELGVIAEKLSVPASAAHRILVTLAERGYVTQNPTSQIYSLSLRLAQVGFRYLDTRALPDEAGQAVLDALARATGEYCRLAIVDGDDIAWVAKAQGAAGGLRYEPQMGQAVVLHATATGKAWLATLPENEALRLVFDRGFDSRANVGPNCVRSVDKLRRHLKETRKRGYATAIEEAEAGTAALAVAFHTHTAPNAPIAGTLSVAGPIARLRPSRHADVVAALHQAASEMTALWPLRKRQMAPSLLPLPTARTTGDISTASTSL